MQTVEVLIAKDDSFALDLVERDFRLIAQIFENGQDYYFFHATDSLLAYVKQLPYDVMYALDSVTTR